MMSGKKVGILVYGIEVNRIFLTECAVEENEAKFSVAILTVFKVDLVVISR